MTYRLRLAPAVRPVFRSDVARLFDDVFTPVPRRSWAPESDVRETDAHYELSIDIPGVPAEQVELTVEGRTLTIRAERPARDGRGASTVQRAFHLPEGTDAEHITARAEHGVLTVQIAKPAAQQPRRIPITSPAVATATA
ncbi:MAG: Hsp20/alpha crystallin family protein [Gemmatimonadaceae bacterium]|jgi:HSP20 family protein|nr:Hsp20/alpha crystallin family protein [Gemmatimonadaceae bacterium]